MVRFSRITRIRATRLPTNLVDWEKEDLTRHGVQGKALSFTRYKRAMHCMAGKDLSLLKIALPVSVLVTKGSTVLESFLEEASDIYWMLFRSTARVFSVRANKAYS
jgi:hypothetical protein